MLLVLTVTLFVVAVALRTPPKLIVKTIKLGLPLLGIAAVFHIVFRLWFITTGQEATWAGHIQHTVFFLLRLVLFVVTTAVLTSCHSPVTYAQALARGLGRVTGWKIAKQVGHVSQLALSMVPQFEQFLNQRKLARKLRGITLSNQPGKRIEYVRNELYATFQFSLGYAQSLATVLWSRGFREDLPLVSDCPSKVRGAALAYCCLFCLICLSTLQR